MRKYTIIVEHSDRIIYIEENESELYGVNFMQGAGDLEYFERDGFAQNDEKLFKFVKSMIDYPMFKHMSFIEKIDEIIWLHIRLEEEKRDDREAVLHEVTKAWLDANEFDCSLDEVRSESLTIQDEKFKEYLLEQFHNI